MANAKVETPQGTSAALGTQTFVSNVLSVTMGNTSIQMLNVSHLGLAAGGPHEKQGADLYDSGQTVVEYQFDPHADQVVPTSTAESLTITLPNYTTTAGNWAGTGCVVSVTEPTLNIDQIMTASFTFEWDGKTDRAFTKGT